MDAYIKLSRVRKDYGIYGRQGTSLHMSELDNLTSDQLFSLRKALLDELEDIGFQIACEIKNPSTGPQWLYAAKASRNARQSFVDRINEIIPIESSVSESEIAVKFMRIAKVRLSSADFSSILKSATGSSSEVFTADDV